MAKRLQFRRLLWLGVLLVSAFAGLGYRLVQLQVVRHDELSAEAQRRTQQRFLLEPRRGDILDTKGNPLATSVRVRTIRADLLLIRNRQAEVAHALAPLLQLSETRLQQLLMSRLPRGAELITNRFVELGRKLPEETWRKIQATMSALSFGVDEKKLPSGEQDFYKELREKAIFAVPDQLRVYPNQNLAAHVLGYVGEDDGDEVGGPGKGMRGKDGIELTFDGKLRGMRGWRLTEKDRRGRELVAFREQDVEASDGLSVVLSIDSVIQHIVESAMAEAVEKYSPISVSGIVVRPRTGEILAMGTLPNFDPNHLEASSPETRRNRVVTDTAEPGSTFKIVVVSGALNDDVVRLTDSFDCEHSRFYYAGHTLHDHESYGLLSVEGIIARSSNIGAAKIGIKLGQNRLYNYICDFGFGKRTGIPLPGEVWGILHPLPKWTKVSIAQIPMGQGIAVTRLQMMMAMCAIANQGVLMRPMLVERLEDRDHHVAVSYAPQRVRQVISEPAAKLMVKALKAAVLPEGTAAKAALDHYTVAGKTGTAQKIENGVYVHDKFFSSFIGFFPADNPEICISVMIDEPKHGSYGGQTAAPVFKRIAEQVANYLNIRPEDGDGSSRPDGLGAPLETRPLKTAAVRTP
jgi:cell division protein FtsI/penicillin-binding protein 2